MIEVVAVNIEKAILRYDLEEISYKMDNYGRGKRTFKYKEDFYRTAIGEMIIRIAMGKRFGLSNEQLRFYRNENGKPYLKNQQGIHFNISHSGSWVISIVSDQEVGIDMEKNSGLYLDIADRFFTKEEREYIYMSCGNDQISRFYEIWTLKESYIKALGKGLSLPLDSFEISQKNCKDNVWRITDSNNPMYFFKLYNLDDKYTISIATPSKVFPKEINVVDFEEIYRKFIEL